MTTHKTLAAAQAAAVLANDARICRVIEIDHVTEGRCYICARTTMAMLATKPIPGIVRLVAEYPVIYPAYVPPPARCTRCTAPIAEGADYCASCRRLLAAWDDGEIEISERRPSREPAYKGDE